MSSYFITGSSRGLGLTLARQLAAKPASEVSKVFASARSETEPLKNLVAENNGRVEFVQLDVTSEESAKKAASTVEQSLGEKGLDVLINNAGVMPSTKGGVINMNDLDDVFKINVTGVHYVTRAFLPLLEKGSLKKLINISTSMGSIEKAPVYNLVPTPAYKISKAALNMLTVQYSLAYADKGFTVISISPGWLKTDLGGDRADLPVEQGAESTLDIVLRVGPSDTGKAFNIHVPGWEKAEGMNQYDGAVIPW
ncbi:uncharacterized protein K452DRAFT_292218 [Aplosporella prunicola CBS 121167]|uniref:Uncharacterized protein n=1 Tax=Aplosporella prunicola CBS 121167 TaxID=1176127 RepID=A0A6A6B0E9_9PEZI|nr:uncharacterized protein K452DRAFT_292218 [Aplosporella prunicola CBS 121167]KAF2136705.1 hypothetical protein K452DRAFT_292218 [Aplosporella prunicola CBS 121167]